jgi:alpha-ketoglutarate-dependent taurine dioxygenase
MVTIRTSSIEIKPLAGAIDAELHGTDLSQKLSDEFKAILDAFLEQLVIFLPQANELEPRDLRNFASHFGSLDEEPFVVPLKVPALDGYPEVYNNIKEADIAGPKIPLRSGTTAPPIIMPPIIMPPMITSAFDDTCSEYLFTKTEGQL